jgi:MFS family permease
LQRLFGYLKTPLVGPLMHVFFISSLSMSVMEATLVLLVGDRFGWGLREMSFGFAYVGVVSTFNQGFLVRKLLPKIGERKLLVMGLAFMALSLLTIAFSYSVAMMGVAMTILSFGNSFTNPATMGSISLLSSSEEQGAVLGTTQSLSSLGRILGPAFGGFVYSAIGNSSPFLFGAFSALIGFVIVLTIYKKLPESALRVGH